MITFENKYIYIMLNVENEKENSKHMLSTSIFLHVWVL